MLVVELIYWWYSSGWVSLAKRLLAFITIIYRYFSVSLLSKTLFVPWKRITTYGSRSLNERMRALLDNLISRLVGFSVRIMVLLVAMLLILTSSIMSLAALVLWPLLPVAVPLLVVRTFMP